MPYRLGRPPAKVTIATRAEGGRFLPLLIAAVVALGVALPATCESDHMWERLMEIGYDLGELVPVPADLLPAAYYGPRFTVSGWITFFGFVLLGLAVFATRKSWRRRAELKIEVESDQVIVTRSRLGMARQRVVLERRPGARVVSDRASLPQNGIDGPEEQVARLMLVDDEDEHGMPLTEYYAGWRWATAAEQNLARELARTPHEPRRR